MEKTQRSILLILKLILFVVILYIPIDFLCRLGVKCNECPVNYLTEVESKEKKYFITEYYPSKNKFISKFNKYDTLKLIKIWAEYEYFNDKRLCLFPREKLTGNIYFHLESIPDLSRTVKFGLEGSYFRNEGRLKELPDKLYFTLVERDEDNNLNYNKQYENICEIEFNKK